MATETLRSVAPYRLRYAREYYALSIQDVAGKTGIDEITLRNYEAGIEFPAYDTLETLANVYKRPLIFFFFRKEFEDQEDEVCASFRAVEKQSGKPADLSVRLMMEKANLMNLNLRELYEELGNDSVSGTFYNRMRQERIESGRDLERWLRNKISLEIQKQLRQPYGFLEYIRKVLYDSGIFVHKDSRNNSVAGLCLYKEDFPVILVNNKMAFTRQIFTVFHEIYQLFIRNTNVYYTEDEETACDSFAGHLLIPSDDLMMELTKRHCETVDDLGIVEELAALYKVSETTLAFRLREEGRMSDENYEIVLQRYDKWIRDNRDGAPFFGNFYLTQINYLGKPYLSTVYSNYYKGRISLQHVAKYTGFQVMLASRMTRYVTDFLRELQ